MNAARWEQVQAIYLSLLERPSERHDALLAQACGDDAKLREEVASLLHQHREDPGFLEDPIVALDQLDPSAVTEATDRYVGPYRLVRPLGQGGMGEVYLAVQEGEDFRQSVAVKVIRPGLDTGEVLERFRLERRILATLQHPNIARLLDGGVTEDGRPFFVMEYIEGLPIDEYADHHNLSVLERLELFEVVAAAVQHAHQNLIVHRDIKPGNILVTATGAPKLLDFGIGKVLGSDAGFGPTIDTRTQLRVLTPEYAAPEQVRGEPATTATDVYGLGVLLYELLTGHRPYSLGKGTALEIERAVCTTDPPQPSTVVTRVEPRTRVDGSTETLSPALVSERRATDPGRLRRRLAGDLDNIVLMALRKEPSRRYPSAAAFGDDLRRHVDGLPVLARGDTFGYRAGKFVRRNVGAVAATIAVFLALVTSTAVTLVQSRRVTRERDVAVEERAKAVEVRGFLLEMFGGTGASQAATDTLTAKQLLDLQAARIDESYTDQPALRAEMMWVLADGYDRLGLLPAADSLARRGLALRQEIHGAMHRDVAASLNQVGWVNHEMGQLAEAVPLLEEAVAIRRALGESQRLELSRSLNDLGVVVDRFGDSERAETLLLEALAIRTAAHGEGHRSVGVTANNLAATYYRLGRNREAIEFEERALRALRASVGPDHQRSIIAQSNLAVFQMREGALAPAERTLRDLLERQTRVQGADHPITALVMANLGSVLTSLGRPDEAEGLFRRSLAIRVAKLGPNHPDVASTLGGLGRALDEQGRFDEAYATHQRAMAIRRATLGDAHVTVGTSLAGLARLSEAMGRLGQAEQHYRNAIAIWEQALDEDHPRLASLRGTFGKFLLGRNKPEESLLVLSRAHAVASKGRSRSLVHETRLGMVDAALALGYRPMADSLLGEARAADTADQLTEKQRAYLRRLEETRSAAQ